MLELRYFVIEKRPPSENYYTGEETKTEQLGQVYLWGAISSKPTTLVSSNWS